MAPLPAVCDTPFPFLHIGTLFQFFDLWNLVEYPSTRSIDHTTIIYLQQAHDLWSWIYVLMKSMNGSWITTTHHRRCNMSDVYSLKVNRGYQTKDSDGNQVTKNRWVQIGSMSKNKGNGHTMHLDLLPLVIDGTVEKIQVFKIEKKEENNDAI